MACCAQAVLGLGAPNGFQWGRAYIRPFPTFSRERLALHSLEFRRPLRPSPLANQPSIRTSIIHYLHRTTGGSQYHASQCRRRNTLAGMVLAFAFPCPFLQEGRGEPRHDQPVNQILTLIFRMLRGGPPCFRLLSLRTLPVRSALLQYLYRSIPPFSF